MKSRNNGNFRRPGIAPASADAPVSAPVTPGPHARAPGVQVTQTLGVYGGLTLFMGLAAMNSQANLLFAVFGLMVGVLLVSWGLSRVVIRRLDVTRDLPEAATVGRPATVVYRFHNQKRFWPSLSVGLREVDGSGAFAAQPQAYLVHAAPGHTADVPAGVVPRRRGLVELDRFQLTTSFPFGFVRRAVAFREPGRLVVGPPVGWVEPRLIALCRSAEQQGANLRPQHGGSDEFYGLTDYRGGSPRSIYWRRSAKTGQLVSKVMTRVAPPRILLAVDTYARSAADRGELARVEKAIAMAASVAAAALDQGLAVGLVARTADGWARVWPTAGKQQRRHVTTVLAELPLNPAHDADALLGVARELTEAATTVLMLTPHEVDPGTLERARGRLVVLTTARAETDAWFRFPPDVDFAHTMPVAVERSVAEAEEAAAPKPPRRGWFARPAPEVAAPAG